MKSDLNASFLVFSAVLLLVLATAGCGPSSSVCRKIDFAYERSMSENDFPPLKEPAAVSSDSPAELSKKGYYIIGVAEARDEVNGISDSKMIAMIQEEAMKHGGELILPEMVNKEQTLMVEVPERCTGTSFTQVLVPRSCPPGQYCGMTTATQEVCTSWAYKTVERQCAITRARVFSHFNPLQNALRAAMRDPSVTERRVLPPDIRALISNVANRNLALLLASRYGDTGAVIELIKKGADVNAKDEKGWTALMIASRYGYTDIAKLLIDKGADINAKSNSGTTTLMCAAYGGNYEIAKLLIDKGAEVNADGNYDYDYYNVNCASTALHCAAVKGHHKIVKLFIENGADINVKSKEGGNTALMNAAYGGNYETVKLLIDKGADVNAMSKEYEKTALMIASELGNYEIAKLLIEKGTDVNAQGKGNCSICGKTALMEAAFECHYKIIKLLVDNGADVNAKSVNRETALQLSSRCSYMGDKLKNLLLKAGAK